MKGPFWLIGALLCASGLQATTQPPLQFCDPTSAPPSPVSLTTERQSTELADVRAQLEALRLQVAEQTQLLQRLLNPPRPSKKRRVLQVALGVLDHTGSAASILSELGVVK